MNTERASPIVNHAIVATKLTKWFREGDTKKVSVNQAEFVANYGEMLFIAGPSGSGKTTLLSMICVCNGLDYCRGFQLCWCAQSAEN